MMLLVVMLQPPSERDSTDQKGQATEHNVSYALERPMGGIGEEVMEFFDQLSSSCHEPWATNRLARRTASS
jgi:hypothetical protein